MKDSDTGDLPSIEAIDKLFLGLGKVSDAPLGFSEAQPYQVPAIRPKAKPKKHHNIKRRNKRK